VLLWEVLCAVSGCCARGAGAELGLLWAGHRVGPAGGTSGWSSLEFLHTITIVCVFVYACVCEGQVLHLHLPHKHEESSSCHDYRVCFRLNIMLFSYDNICFCIALLLFVKISKDLQDLNNF